MGARDAGSRKGRAPAWLRALLALVLGAGPSGIVLALWRLATGGPHEDARSGGKGNAQGSAGPSRASLEAQREVKDMGHVWVAFAGGALFLGLIILLVFLWGLQTMLGRPPDPPALRPSAIAHAGDSARSDLFRARAPGLFPDPSGDLARYRAWETARAPAYGWIDRKSGIIAIPVERAMDRIRASGWPQWRFPGPSTRPADAAEASTWKESP